MQPVNRGARLVTQHPHVMANYGRLEINIVRGEGCRLYDESGNAYLDMVAGIAVCALGHAHPRIARAVAEQAATLVHVSNLVHYEPTGTLADRLAELAGFDAVFFCNSGAEANEAAIKLARKHAWRRGEKERNVILSAKGSFHGRTMGALAATDNPKYHEGFEPLPRGFRHVAFNDLAALDGAITEHTAAFLIEPVQGESGVVPATREYLLEARRLCTQRGALLIFDEIQCGMGRLGRLFAHQFFDVLPDSLTLAKSLANGLPIGALIVRGEAASSLKPGDHGTTFGGSPVPAAAALEHLKIREILDLDTHVEAMGALLLAELRQIAAEFPAVFDEPRGFGLMLGLPVREPHAASAFVPHGLDNGLLINAAGRNTLRFVPPLIINADEIREALQRLRATIAVTLA
ncbi:aspartate aminotransferase family protein [Vulcanimicrobium alpinum]|uniref:aspartate aminotransferase family protein n=1 Tax=Vulcanimicrobium alpinum TaxID=3016050 RepID=UPI00295F5545|nr:aspartate aminotransferase family protein [Vulcanimicrobium alpinum]